MALATLQAVVDALTSTVDYLRVSVDAPGEDWLPCEALCTDAVTLHTVVATTKSANGISTENEPAVSVTERAAANAATRWRCRCSSRAMCSALRRW